MHAVTQGGNLRVRHLSVLSAIALLCAGALCSNTSQAQEADPPAWSPQPAEQDTRVDKTYASVATYVTTVGAAPQICFGDPNGGTSDLVFEYRLYRFEGGPKAAHAAPRATWRAQPVATNHCIDSVPLPRAGHWIYEARLCRGELCSAWVSAIVPSGQENGAGTVNDQPQGWWIYAYLAAPGGIEL